jgi:hypothetical protein
MGEFYDDFLTALQSAEMELVAAIKVKIET